MNEAMKTLIDKEPPEPAQSSRGTPGLESKQAAIEISGYRREIDSMRKEIAIVSLFD